MHDHDHDHDDDHANEAAQGSYPLPLEPGDRLEIVSTFASLEVRPIEAGGAARVEVRGRHADAARIVVGRDASTVHVEVEPTAAHVGGLIFGRRSQPVRLLAFVPVSGLRAQLVTSAGRMSISRLRGVDLEVSADAGAIDLDDVEGRMQLVTSAGRIEGRALSGSIEASTDAGSIRLEIAHLAPGRHSVTTSVGSVRLELARGLPVQIEAHATMGSARVDVRSTPGAAAVLEANADLGSVRVRESARYYERPDTQDARIDMPTQEGPFRTAARTPIFDGTLDRVLARVANGELAPQAAADLLRALSQG
jgi:hypothetical protein